MARVLLRLFMVSPFIAVAVIILRVIRALRSRELMAGGGHSRMFNVRQQTSPIFFWVEIGLHLVAGVFLFGLGMLFTNQAPTWLKELMIRSVK